MSNRDAVIVQLSGFFLTFVWRGGGIRAFHRFQFCIARVTFWSPTHADLQRNPSPYCQMAGVEHLPSATGAPTSCGESDDGIGTHEKGNARSVALVDLTCSARAPDSRLRSYMMRYLLALPTDTDSWHACRSGGNGPPPKARLT